MLDERLKSFATERQAEIMDAVQREGSHGKAAEALGIHRSAVGRALQAVEKKAALRGFSPDHAMVHTVPDGFKVKGVSTYYNEDGKPTAQWVKSTADRERQAEIYREFVAALAEEVRGHAAPVPAPGPCEDDSMCVYVLGDGHIGMRAHGKETLSEDFDSEIAQRDIQYAIDILIAKAPATKRAIFIDCGDLTHANSRDARTPTGGNLLDVDTRHRRTTRIAAFAIRYCIEAMLKKHEHVTVDIVEGNHNLDTAGHIAMALSMYYEREPRVFIHDDPAKFHYFQFGKCLIGTTHGDTVKHQDLPSIMATQKPKEWGDSMHRHWIVGHIHHKQLTEYRGCHVESFNTLAASDAWHAAHGYISKREMNLLVFDREDGVVARSICPIGLIRRKQAEEVA